MKQMEILVEEELPSEQIRKILSQNEIPICGINAGGSAISFLAKDKITLPMYLNAGFPVVDEPEGLMARILSYKQRFTQVKGVNLSAKAAYTYDGGKEIFFQDMRTLTEFCKKLGLEVRFVIDPYSFVKIKEIARWILQTDITKLVIGWAPKDDAEIFQDFLINCGLLQKEMPKTTIGIYCDISILQHYKYFLPATFSPKILAAANVLELLGD